ncbi:hypothetical protein [Arthrobacter sp. H5]|uniref:hypothetical protein n=1 Tax=Arthrobacter sp. H5 TaxID=1267973 RepID=UPI0004B57414|nr:hypothetical protein [Arthrobacter sp. H5]
MKTATSSRNGRTRVTKAALTHTVQAVAADAFDIPRNRVSTAIEDRNGLLGISVEVPAIVHTLGGAGNRTGGSLFERADLARARIHEQAGRLTGSELRAIEIALTGIHTLSRARTTLMTDLEDWR